MRETKKVLRFKKFKIANLNRLQIVGGVNSVPTQPIPDPVEFTDQDTCPSAAHLMCTQGATRTEVKNGCGGDNPDGNGGFQTGPGCP